MPRAVLTEPLTIRQIELIAHVANGLTFEEIAEQEMISPKTVKNTLDMARRRVGAKNLPNLVALVVSAGIIGWIED